MISRKIFKKNIALDVVLILLIITTMTTFFSISYLFSFDKNVKKTQTESNTEDFHYIEKYGRSLSQENIDELKKNGIELEKVPFKEIVQKDQRFHIFEDINFKINKPVYISGSAPKTDNEIALSNIYMENNDLSIDDFISIGNTTYKISGSIFLTNYTSPISNIQISVLNDKNSAIFAIVKNETLKNNSYYVSGKSKLEIDEVKEMISKYTSVEPQTQYPAEIQKEIELSQKVSGVSDGLFMFTPAKENIRLEYYNQEYSQIQNILIYLFIASIISTISILFLYIRYKKTVNVQTMGIVYSLGYSNKKVLSIFLLSILKIFAIASLTSIFLYFLAVENIIINFIKKSYVFFLPISNTMVIFLSVIIFLILIAIICTSYMMVINRAQISDILRGNVSKVIVKLKINFFKNPMNKLRLLDYFSISKYIVITIISFLAISSTLSLLFVNTYITLANDVSNTTLKYNNAIYYEKTRNDFDDKNKFTTYRTYMEENKDFIQVYGVSPETDFLMFEDKNKNNITPLLDKGAIINLYVAKKYNLKVGDTISFKNAITDSYSSLEIVGINNIPWKNFIYTSKKNLNNILGIQENYYNSEYTLKSESDIQNSNEYDNIAFIENKQELLDSFLSKSNIYLIVSLICLIINIIIISSTIIFIIIININEKQKSISILSSLGYTNKKIYNIIVSSYFLDTIISVTIATFVTYLIYLLKTNKMVQTSSVIPPNEFNIMFHIFIILFFVALYYTISKILFKKIKNMDISVILKED